MPRPSTTAPRTALQTTAASASRKLTIPKQTSSSARSAMFSDSPKAVEQASAAAAVTSNPLDAVPDSPPPGSQISSTTSSQSVRPSSSKGKRSKKELKADSPTHEAEPVFEIPQEMQQMLQSFSHDLAKSITAKKRKLEQVTGSSVTTGNRKFDEVWKAQQSRRQKMSDEFRKQVQVIFQQWETDLEKTRENEEKLQNQLRQQQKVFSQVRVVQAQRLKSLRDIFDMHAKEVEEMDRAHQEQQASLMVDVKKEMATMQRKILVDCQQQEMCNLRKSLNAMFP